MEDVQPKHFIEEHIKLYTFIEIWNTLKSNKSSLKINKMVLKNYNAAN